MNKTPIYAAIDSETGGLDPSKHSLLTFAIVLANSDFEEVDAIEVRVKHDVYTVTAKALEGNGIGLVEHHALAKTPIEARNALTGLLERNYAPTLVPIGHNPGMDIAHGKALMGEDLWRFHFDYHVMDTGALLTYWRATGEIPLGAGNLVALATYFGVALPNAHTAIVDARMTLAIVRAAKERGL